MSDDLRERTPIRDQGDNPVEAGSRSDRGASDGGAPGYQPGPGGQDPANNAQPLVGQGSGSAGGYGTGSDVGSSGGSQERTDGSGSDVGPETEWLRETDTSSARGTAGRDATAEEGIATRGSHGLGANGTSEG